MVVEMQGFPCLRFSNRIEAQTRYGHSRTHETQGPWHVSTEAAAHVATLTTVSALIFLSVGHIEGLFFFAGTILSLARISQRVPMLLIHFSLLHIEFQKLGLSPTLTRNRADMLHSFATVAVEQSLFSSSRIQQIESNLPHCFFSLSVQPQ